jgi:signal recognition particle receptor subunit beta
MPLIDTASSQITFKIVYYGPPMSGKSTNLRWIYRTVPEKGRGQFSSIVTGTERILFFDFLPAELGTIKGFETRLSLYAVPGRGLNRLTGKAVLRAVDGLVFVADSSINRRQDNVRNLADMAKDLGDLDLSDTPVVFQLNKRDAPDVMTVSDMTADLGLAGKTVFLGVASEGVAVTHCLESIAHQVAGRT